MACHRRSFIGDPFHQVPIGTQRENALIHRIEVAVFIFESGGEHFASECHAN